MQGIASNWQFHPVPKRNEHGSDEYYKKQAQALAVLSIFASTSAAFGPSIGGFLIGAWDWPSIFLVNLPFIILGIVLAVIVLPKPKQASFDLKRIDGLGIALFIVTIAGLILFLLSLDQNIRWWALGVFIIGSLLFYLQEKRRNEPFIDLAGLKKNKNATLVYAQFMSINLIYYCYFFGFPTFLQQFRGYSEEHTGLIMLALAGFSVIVSPLAGRIIDHHGSKLPMVIGAILLLVGTGLLLTYRETSPLIWFLVIMSVLGMSNGFNNISAQTALYEHVKPEDTGSASGLFQTSRYLGSILSGSLLGMTFNAHVDQAHLHLVAIICFIFCLAVVALSLLLPGKIKVWNR
ncbi:MFS transporter [Virgibacillus sp. 179-BFC.A HS]|uniref:MFS transporter n=1 Tax=Tigheibacillus jepli TaxID=3035914 RepID=A0ABU5CL47_9BACI|nr:MFS transporter [Virgibacillus sp. 179-BFC.A HS]MDY0407049.1 MFS transporter [Virgibacillus sp. 179-BFC.A HS]